MRIVEKLWGREEILSNTSDYCLKRMYVNPGFKSSLHYHISKNETFVVESGVLFLELRGEKRKLHPGDSVEILHFQKHRFRAVGEMVCVFLEVSTHDDPEDCVRVEPSARCPIT